MGFVFYFFLFLFLFLCFVLSAVILMQESKSTSLGASFGGDSGDSIFGTSTPDILKKFTAYMVAIFMISCVILSLWSTALGSSKIEKLPTEIEETQ